MNNDPRDIAGDPTLPLVEDKRSASEQIADLRLRCQAAEARAERLARDCAKAQGEAKIKEARLEHAESFARGLGWRVPANSMDAKEYVGLLVNQTNRLEAESRHMRDQLRRIGIAMEDVYLPADPDFSARDVAPLELPAHVLTLPPKAP